MMNSYVLLTAHKFALEVKVNRILREPMRPIVEGVEVDTRGEHVPHRGSVDDTRLAIWGDLSCIEEHTEKQLREVEMAFSEDETTRGVKGDRCTPSTLAPNWRS